MRDLTERLLRDPQLQSLKHELALSSARVETLANRLATGDALPSGDECLTLIEQAFAAMAHGQQTRATTALSELSALFETIALEDQTWEEIRKHLLIAERLSRTERSLDIVDEFTVTTPQLTAYLFWVRAIFNTELKNHPDIQQRVRHRMQTLEMGDIEDLDPKRLSDSDPLKTFVSDLKRRT
jgi:hypothetical protein